MTQEQYDFLAKKVEELMQKTKDPVHDFEHVLNVKENALRLKKLLSIKYQQKVDDQILAIICLWHDISYVYYKSGLWQFFVEGVRAERIVGPYLKSAGLSKKERRLIKSAIRTHPHIYHFFTHYRTLYHKILNDADFIEDSNPKRIAQAEATVRQSVFRFLVMKILKPLFYKSYKKYFFNFKESQELLKQYENIESK